MMWLNACLAVGLEELLQSGMSEGLDHVYTVSILFTVVNTFPAYFSADEGETRSIQVRAIPPSLEKAGWGTQSILTS